MFVVGTVRQLAPEKLGLLLCGGYLNDEMKAKKKDEEIR